jgi:AraC-like DNA-binding protein
MDHYQERKPSAPLQPYVECFWEFRSQMLPGESENSLPIGCFDLIFNFGTPYTRRTLFHGEEVTAWLHASGIVNRCVNSLISAGADHKFDIFGVRFTPWGLHGLSGISLEDTQRDCLPPGLYFPGIFPDMERAVQQAEGFKARCGAAERAFAPLLDANHTPALVRLAVARIVQEAGNVNMRALAAGLGVSASWLGKNFYAATSMPPKTFARIMRLNHLIRQMAQKPQGRLTDLAYGAEYFDQSHFTRDFKSLTGMSPKRFTQARFRFSGLVIRAVEPDDDQP